MSLPTVKLKITLTFLYPTFDHFHLSTRVVIDLLDRNYNIESQCNYIYNVYNLFDRPCKHKSSGLVMGFNICIH